MYRLGIAGALWLAAAAFAIAITLIFGTDPVQWVITMAVGAVAAVLGLWLIARPNAMVVSASSGVAVASALNWYLDTFGMIVSDFSVRFSGTKANRSIHSTGIDRKRSGSTRKDARSTYGRPRRSARAWA